MIDRETGWFFVHASIKVVILRDDDVLLAKNPRGEWELVGGSPDQKDESLEDTARRETHEETGLTLGALQLVDATLFSPVPESKVVLISYVSAPAPSSQSERASSEHSRLEWFPIHHLPATLPNEYASLIGRATDVVAARSPADTRHSP